MRPEDILQSKEIGVVIRCTVLKLAIAYLNILDNHVPQRYFLHPDFTFSATTTKRRTGQSDPSGSDLAQEEGKKQEEKQSPEFNAMYLVMEYDALTM